MPTADRGQLLMVGVALVLGAFAAATFQIARNIALLRIEGKLTTIAEAAVWLCSDRADWVSGVSMVVDGGGMNR